MTELIYFDDCYVKEFDAEVVESEEDRVVLDRTAFYPEGGGQPSDTGEMDGYRVRKVEKGGGKVEHVLGGGAPGPGSTVHCILDWERRYSHMRYHTAQHIISAIVLDDYGGATTGNQLYADRARIDFDVSISDRTEEVEEKVNSVIDEGRDVDIYTLSREEAMEELDPERTRIDLLPESIEELRIVDVEGLDRTACAGTHVKNTEELGEFEITGTESKGKGRKRVEFILR